MTFRPLAFAAAMALCPCVACADIYKYVDADGNVTFTDRYRPGAQKVLSDFGPSRGHTSSTKTRATSRPSPANFPRVTPKTQRQRDDLRHQILLEERSHESRMLAEAQAALAANLRKPGVDVSSLNEALRRHQQNIGMLDKELSRFK